MEDCGPIIIGEYAFEDAVELPDELRDRGLSDFGRDAEMCWHWADEFVVVITSHAL
jgi:hypothetical protein